MLLRVYCIKDYESDRDFIILRTRFKNEIISWKRNLWRIISVDFNIEFSLAYSLMERLSDFFCKFKKSSVLSNGRILLL